MVRERQRRPGILRTLGIFTLGASAGSIVALLYAPASGKVTRRRLALQARALRQRAAKEFTRTQKLLARRAGDLRDATTEQLTHAREWVVDRVTNGHGGRQTNRRRIVHHA